MLQLYKGIAVFQQYNLYIYSSVMDGVRGTNSSPVLQDVHSIMLQLE